MRTRIGLRLAISIIVVAFGMAGAADAQAMRKVITAMTITTFAPFEFKDPETNKLVGSDIDLFNAMAAEMGAEVDWVESSFSELITFSALKTHRVDVLVSGTGRYG